LRNEIIEDIKQSNNLRRHDSLFTQAEHTQCFKHKTNEKKHCVVTMYDEDRQRQHQLLVGAAKQILASLS